MSNHIPQMQPTPITHLRGFLSAPSVVGELTKVLPKNLPAEKLIRQTLTLVQKTPVLLECAQVSILAGMIQAAELGLEMSGQLGQAYLVPRWNHKTKCKEATFQIGYRGMILLAYRSGVVKSLTMRVVRGDDVFHISYGSEARLTHEPNLERADPAEAVGYYALVKLNHDGEDFEFMSIEEVQAHRHKYSPPPQKDKPDSSPWASDFDQMALKTVSRRLLKRLPFGLDLPEDHDAVMLAPPVAASPPPPQTLAEKLSSPWTAAEEAMLGHTNNGAVPDDEEVIEGDAN